MADSINRFDAVPNVDVLGIRLDLLTASETRAWLDRAVREPWDGRCRHVVTLNPEYVMAARKNSTFRIAIERADLVTADGVGVTVAARLIHGATAERVTGVEIMELLAEISGPAEAPIFLLGAGEGVADEALARLAERHPGMRSAGTWSAGAAAPEYDAPAFERIVAGNARVVAVAYGAPGQVLWIDRNRERLDVAGVRLAIGVGGALDYISETVEQPPELMRRFGLEWLFRLVREPHRWRRQTVLPVFAIRVLVEAGSRRLRQP